MKLSIIIPAYNVEQYIGNCLKSIFSQQIENGQLEVFVVNDGSVDDTEIIIKEYADKHPNLIYIRQKNQGQSVARNEGLPDALIVDSNCITKGALLDSLSFLFSHEEEIKRQLQSIIPEYSHRPYGVMDDVRKVIQN